MLVTSRQGLDPCIVQTGPEIVHGWKQRNTLWTISGKLHKIVDFLSVWSLLQT